MENPAFKRSTSADLPKAVGDTRSIKAEYQNPIAKVGTMSHISADRDSLVALDALLRMGGLSAPGSTKKEETTSQKNNLSEKKPKEIKSRPVSDYKTGSLQGKGHVRGNAGMLLPQVDANSCSPAQIAALQAAASYGNAFVSSGTSFSVHAAAAHLLSSSAAAASAGQLNNATANQSETTVRVDAPVRKEKVEAALRSKPQRGRKREDLSEKERLELTRTRNREHAKSTRIRKKARYQELLDCEQKLKLLERTETLRQKRSDSVLRFLSIRQRMVANAASESTYSTTVSALDEVVCSISNFQFEISSNADQRDSQSSKNSSSDIEEMKDWDMSFVQRVTESYGPGAERFVEIKTVGGADGIALSKDGSGFIHVEIVHNINEPRLLLSATLSFQFAPESDQIRSASWTTVHEYCAPQQQPKRARASVAENLGNMLVYPSVVSLDAEKAVDEEDSNESSAPGMNI